MKEKGIIALTGFMGSGKSTVGKMLAERLGWAFLDLDGAVEKAAGKSVPQIFAEDGEEAFRKLEISTLRKIIRSPAKFAAPPAGLVLALGGGTLMRPEARKILGDGGCPCIYLKAGVETLAGRLEGAEAAARPLLAGATTPPALRATSPRSGEELLQPSKGEEFSLRSRIETLLGKREAVYSSVAALTVPVDGLPAEDIVSRIAEAL